MKDEIRVPDGFSLKVDGYKLGADVVMSPGGYFATIDWRSRCFRSGMTMLGATVSQHYYKGSGWRQRLIDDTVKWLSKLDKVGIAS